MGKKSKGWEPRYVICYKIDCTNDGGLPLLTNRGFETIAQADYFLEKNNFLKENYVITQIFKYV